MPTLTPCPQCACHVSTRDTSCPHCGTTLPTGSALRPAAAALLGLTLVASGCPTISLKYGQVSNDDAPPDSAQTADTGDEASDDR